MGCDIHGWIERKVGNKWVAVSELTERGRFRNYRRFAALAGVRGDGPAAVGVPSDVSDTAKYWIEYYGADGHSHSCMSLSRALDVFFSTDMGQTDSMLGSDRFFFDYFGLDVYGGENDPIGDFRLVFWFDN